MSPVGFEPTILKFERPQSYTLDRSATGIGDRSLIAHMCRQLSGRTEIKHGDISTGGVQADIYKWYFINFLSNCSYIV
jgi:hypothetical protein